MFYLLPDQLVKIKIGTKNKTYYNKLGYEGKLKDEILVNVKHVSNGTRVNIVAICDYCGKRNENILLFQYNRQVEKTIVKKYACDECKHIKQQEVYFEEYGSYSYNGLTIEKVKKEFEERGYKLLSTEFKTRKRSTEYLDYICNEHPEDEQKIVYNSFQRGSGCKYCGLEKIKENNKNSFEFVNEQFIKKDLILLETDYKNSDIKMKYICKKHPGNIQEITFASLHYANCGCKLCGIEKLKEERKLDFNYVKQIFKDKNLVLLEDEYINNNTKMKYICLSHPDIIQEDTLAAILARKNYNCRYCYLDNTKGENSSSWKGGLTPLHNYLRRHITQWKLETMKNNNYKCALTGNKFDIIHHLYSFNLILEETLKETGLPLFKVVSMYSEEEKEILQKKCLELHFKHGFGICLTNQIHDLFHKIYGRQHGNNTPEQFEEFAQRYYNGEFNNIINKSA